MTNEFAIDILEQCLEKPTLINEIKTVKEAIWLYEALTMAIKSLKQEPVDAVLVQMRNEFIDRYPRS